MYNGLTIADKPALEEAQARGAEWVARDSDNDLYGYAVEPIDDVNYGWTIPFIGNVITINSELMKFVLHHEKVNIDLALAQIAEMESDFSAVFPDEEPMVGKNPERKPPLTWNERINQMTVEEKADVAVIMSKRCARALEKESCPDLTCWQCFIEFFNSPYTEGETT